MSHDSQIRNLKFKKRFEGRIRYINRETGLIGALMDSKPVSSHPTLPNSTNISFGPSIRTTIDVHENVQKNVKKKRASTQSTADQQNKMNLYNVKLANNDEEKGFKKNVSRIKLPKLNSGRCQSVPDDWQDRAEELALKKKKLKSLRI